MKKEMRISAIDYDLLAPSYRPRVLLVFSAILSPLSYAITFGIYMLLRKPLNSYLMPKVKEISTNEKELLFRRKPTVSQTVGGVISATTALFAASYFASAVNVIVTPRENQNGFNKTNDAIGRIYSFGLAGNTEDIKAMSQFLRQVNGQFVTEVQNLVEYNPSTQTFDKTDSANKAVATEISKYAFLFESPEAAKAIFDSLVSKINLAPINVLNLAFDEIQNADHNLDASAQQVRKMENLIKFVATNNILASKLPLIARQALLDRLIKAIQGFEYSSYMNQYQAAVNTNERANQQIAGRIKDLKDNRDNLAKAIADQSKLVNVIETNAGFKSFSSDVAHPDTVFSFKETSVDRSTAAAGSEIAKNVIIEVSDKAAMDAQKQKLDAAKLAYDTYHAGTFVPEDQVKNSKEADNRDKKSAVDAKTDELRNANSVLSARTSDLTQKQRELDELERRIAALPNLINLAQVAVNAATANLIEKNDIVTKRTNELSAAQAEEAKARGELQSLETTLTAAKGAVANAQTKLDQAKAALAADPNNQALVTAKNIAQNELNDANKALGIAQENRDNKIKEIAAIGIKVAAAQTNLTSAQEEQRIARENKANKESEHSQLVNELANKNNSHQSYIDARNAAQTAKTNAENAVTRISGELATVTQEYNDQIAQFNAYLNSTYNPIVQKDESLRKVMEAEQATLEAKTNTYNQQKAKVDGLIQTVNIALTNNQSGLPEVHSRINEANKNIDTLTAAAPHIFDSTNDHAD